MIEVDRRKRVEERATVEADPFVRAVLEAFPGTVIGEIKTLAPAVELPVIPDEADAASDED
jgi:DNA polymerase-3 subunit gamma/tau